MLRSVARTALFGLLIVLCAGAAQAALWPDQVNDFKKVSSGPAAVADRPLWDECGLNLSEEAHYASTKARFTVTAWRLQDPTAALAAFEWQRPADAQPSQLAEMAAAVSDGVVFIYGNYLFRFDGWKPAAADLNPFLDHLAKLDQSPLPGSYLPSKGLVANSERYALGPAGLERFEPGVPVPVAAFSQGAELQTGEYDTKGGRLRLAIFSYPTPQIARQRLEGFQKVSGALAKRTGPLVAVITSPKDADAAERLLATVKYNATISENERIPTKRDNVGDLIWNIFILIGIILVMFIVGGLAFGIARRFGWNTADDSMTVLHLEDHTRELHES